VIEQAASRVANREGLAQVPARIRDIENKLIGFEIMVGPFAVAQMLVGRKSDPAPVRYSPIPFVSTSLILWPILGLNKLN